MYLKEQASICLFRCSVGSLLQQEPISAHTCCSHTFFQGSQSSLQECCLRLVKCLELTEDVFLSMDCLLVYCIVHWKHIAPVYIYLTYYTVKLNCVVIVKHKLRKTSFSFIQNNRVVRDGVNAKTTRFFYSITPFWVGFL